MIRGSFLGPLLKSGLVCYLRSCMQRVAAAGFHYSFAATCICSRHMLGFFSCFYIRPCLSICFLVPILPVAGNVCFELFVRFITMCFSCYFPSSYHFQNEERIYVNVLGPSF